MFELFYKFEQKNKSFLFSHAGIADSWINDWYSDESSDKQLECLNYDFKATSKQRITKVLSDISFYRGGYMSNGSIVWRDVREPISNRFGYQIFGHTMLSNPIATIDWACLDCKRLFILDNENNICNFDGSKVEIYGE